MPTCGNGEHYCVTQDYCAFYGCFVSAKPIGEDVTALPAMEPPPVEASTSKPTNPKDAIGSAKLPLHLVPSTGVALASLAFLNGALKYGRANWRDAGVRASIYVDAAKRHLDAWFEGEQYDPDDGVPHLAAAIASIMIMVDADAAGKLTDDRQMPIEYRAYITKLTTHVPRLQDLHKGRDPYHFTINHIPAPK